MSSVFTTLHCLQLKQGAAVSRWRVLEKSVLNPKNDDMTNLMNMADKLIKELVSVAKKFKKPLKK